MLPSGVTLYRCACTACQNNSALLYWVRPAALALGADAFLLHKPSVNDAAAGPLLDVPKCICISLGCTDSSTDDNVFSYTWVLDCLVSGILRPVANYKLIQKKNTRTEYAYQQKRIHLHDAVAADETLLACAQKLALQGGAIVSTALKNEIINPAAYDYIVFKNSVHQVHALNSLPSKKEAKVCSDLWLRHAASAPNKLLEPYHCVAYVPHYRACLFNNNVFNKTIQIESPTPFLKTQTEIASALAVMIGANVRDTDPDFIVTLSPFASCNQNNRVSYMWLERMAGLSRASKADALFASCDAITVANATPFVGATYVGENLLLQIWHHAKELANAPLPQSQEPWLPEDLTCLSWQQQQHEEEEEEEQQSYFNILVEEEKEKDKVEVGTPVPVVVCCTQGRLNKAEKKGLQDLDVRVTENNVIGATHLIVFPVAPATDVVEIKPSFKVLYAICKGLKIVSPKWISDLFDQGRFSKDLLFLEKPNVLKKYVVRPSRTESLLGFSMHRALSSAARCAVFKNWGIITTPAVQQNQLPYGNTADLTVVLEQGAKAVFVPSASTIVDGINSVLKRNDKVVNVLVLGTKKERSAVEVGLPRDRRKATVKVYYRSPDILPVVLMTQSLKVIHTDVYLS